MNAKLLILCLTLCISVSLYGYAEDLGVKPPSLPPPTEKEKKPIKILPYNKLRPYGLSSYESDIDCYLQNGIIYITFNEPEGMASVLQIENGTTTLSRSYVSTLSEAKVPFVYSDYPVQLLIKTSVGNEYEGWILPDE